MSRKSIATLTIIIVSILVVLAVVAFTVMRKNAEAVEDAVNPECARPVAFNVWGREITTREAAELNATPEGRAQLDPANGAVAITPEMLKLGRESFYNDAFGNEVPLTQVIGILDGPVNAADFARAVAELGGKGTTNLRVPLSKTVTIAGRKFEKGQVVDTGLDVAKGASTPLGLIVRPGPRGLRTGISCAACHSTVDPDTFQVIHGAPNTDLRAGLILAFASNSAAMFAHADIEDLAPFVKDPNRTVTTSTGEHVALPDPKALEDAVDAAFLKWPPGTFDSMLDLRGDPTQFPTSFTREAYPYGWSGFASIGPFHGLSSLNNNVHGFNSDPLTVVECSPALFHLDKEVYLAIVLQNAAERRFRFDPTKGEKPSEFFAAVDPTPEAPALNLLLGLPTFPKGSLIAPDGLWVSRPGAKVWEHMNALSAWQNSLVPPRPKSPRPQSVIRRGSEIFRRAGCATCHSGAALTNHRIIPAEEIGTEPVRAVAFRRMEGTFADPVGWAFDQTVPLPEKPRPLAIPMDHVEQAQVDLAMGWKGTAGGYKVPALVGLAWSAPYLHDGGVAVGPNERRDLGIPGTLKKNILPDPRLSLKALVDRELRAHVIAANESDAELRAMNARGVGHEFWVDAAAGFSGDEQEALIAYLLAFALE